MLGGPPSLHGSRADPEMSRGGGGGGSRWDRGDVEIHPGPGGKVEGDPRGPSPRYRNIYLRWHLLRFELTLETCCTCKV